MRNSACTSKTVFSSTPGFSITNVPPNVFSLSITAFTNISGAEAPAVTPTLLTPLNQSQSIPNTNPINMFSGFLVFCPGARPVTKDMKAKRFGWHAKVEHLTAHFKFKEDVACGLNIKGSKPFQIICFRRFHNFQIQHTHNIHRSKHSTKTVSEARQTVCLPTQSSRHAKTKDRMSGIDLEYMPAHPIVPAHPMPQSRVHDGRDS